jgi:hypothetical protein
MRLDFYRHFRGAHPSRLLPTWMMKMTAAAIKTFACNFPALPNPTAFMDTAAAAQKARPRSSMHSSRGWQKA